VQKAHHNRTIARARRDQEPVNPVPEVFVWPLQPVVQQPVQVLHPAVPLPAPEEAGDDILAAMPPSPGVEIPFIQFDPNDESFDDEQPPQNEDNDLPDNQNQVGPVQMKKVDEWIACDKCGKWRKVPAHIDMKALESGPWFCNMNSWDNKNKCRAKEEKFTGY
jgi:hypothetical protein